MLSGEGWRITVPTGWVEQSARPPFEARLVSEGPALGRFTVYSVDLSEGAEAFLEQSVRGAKSRGARELARRRLSIGPAKGLVVEYLTQRRESTLLGIGRVVAVPGQALAVVCSSTSERYLTAKSECASILASMRIGDKETKQEAAPGLREVSVPDQAWSIQVPEGWRARRHRAPMVALVVSDDPPRDSVSVSVLSAPVDCAADEGTELAHAYLSDEVAQGSFRLLERRPVEVDGHEGVGFDFFKERSSPAVRVAQVYLAKGDRGIVLSCGTEEDAAASVRDDCNTMFASLRFDDRIRPSSGLVPVQRATRAQR